MAISGVASFVVDQLLPDAQTERITFRKFDGAKLATAAEQGTELKSEDIKTIVLRVNPQELTWNKTKIINKIATNAPGRLIVVDWGHDLDVLGITGVTGNLLPTVFTSGFSPMKGFMEGVVAKIDPTNSFGVSTGAINRGFNTVDVWGAKILRNSMTYFELLDLSKKYKTFVKLRTVYDEFDADMDVLTLELGSFIYRGYFTEFRFSITSDSPWNWGYSIGFVVIQDLSKPLRREDDKMNFDPSIVEKS